MIEIERGMGIGSKMGTEVAMGIGIGRGIQN